MKEKNKGITLIALVITIIVMLILVAVTINMAINGGLFSHAGKAVGDTKNAMNEEQQLANGQITIGDKTYNSIDEYLNEIKIEHKWTRDEDTFKCLHCNAEYIMGDYVDYTPAGKTSTTISAEKSGLDRYYAKKGSYPSASVGVNVDENGVQTIERQDTKWVVLGATDKIGQEGGKDIYSTLLITTKEPVGATADKGVYLYGAASYNNGPSEIKRICKELYSNSEYGEARGMTIEDVNEALNYTKLEGLYFDENRNCQTTGNITTKLGEKDDETGEYKVPVFKSIIGETDDGVSATSTDTSSTDNTEEQPSYPIFTPDAPDTLSTKEKLAEYLLDGYAYRININETGVLSIAGGDTSPITRIERKVIFKMSPYYLASHGVGAYPEYAIFGLGMVRGPEVSSGGFSSGFASVGLEDGDSCGLRPVVSLKSKLPTNFGKPAE